MPNQSRSRFLGLLLSIGAALAVAVGCAHRPSGETPAAEVETTARPFIELEQLGGPPPIGGDAVEGERGDWLLRNERLAVVIGGAAPADRARAGRLLDAAPAAGQDILREIRVAVAAAPLADSEATYHSVVPDAAGAGQTQRALIARGRVRELPQIGIETRYSLAPRSSTLSILTRFVNEGPDTVAFPAADVILWGEAEPFAPGPGFSDAAGADTVAFLTGAARGTAYAWWSPQGALRVSSGPTWSYAVVETVSLAPGDSLRVERRLTVESGTAADAATAVWSEKGTPVGFVAVEAQRGGESVAGARIEVRSPDGRAWSWGETSSRGRVVLPAPAGRCALVASHPRYGIAPPPPLTIEPRGNAKVSLRVLDAATVDLSAVDDRGAPAPARWQFQGMTGTRDPWFGPRHLASGAAEYLFTPTGAATASVPPGRYRVRVTRGPAFEAWEREVTLAPGSRSTLHAELTPIGVPESWVAADLDVLDRSDSECPVSAADRARALVCDGIAWFASERPATLQDEIDASGLAAPLRRLNLDSVDRFGEPGVAPPQLTLADPGRVGGRTYVHADGPGEADVQRALREGKTVSTNGPFVEFTLDGEGIGGTLRRAEGLVRGHVRVVAPVWVDVRRVLIVVNGAVDSAYMVRGRGNPVRFDEDIELYVKNSGFVLVRVEGDEPLGHASIGSIRPLAVTGSIRVEISWGAR